MDILEKVLASDDYIFESELTKELFEYEELCTEADRLIAEQTVRTTIVDNIQLYGLNVTAYDIITTSIYPNFFAGTPGIENLSYQPIFLDVAALEKLNNFTNWAKSMIRVISEMAQKLVALSMKLNQSASTLAGKMRMHIKNIDTMTFSVEKSRHISVGKLPDAPRMKELHESLDKIGRAIKSIRNSPIDVYAEGRKQARTNTFNPRTLKNMAYDSFIKNNQELGVLGCKLESDGTISKVESSFNKYIPDDKKSLYDRKWQDRITKLTAQKTIDLLNYYKSDTEVITQSKEAFEKLARLIGEYEKSDEKASKFPKIANETKRVIGVINTITVRHLAKVRYQALLVNSAAFAITEKCRA